MDYKDFISREDAFKKFVNYRKEILDSADNGTFAEAFTELCTKALAGDCVAQDCVAYFFNKGYPEYLNPDFDYYMSWQILAGANGNQFALEKMEFFLQPALDAIIYDEQILQRALRRKNVTKDNAIMQISNLICEGIVDELQIEPKKLINIRPGPVLYSPELNRVYLDAMEKCLPKVVNFLIS